VTATRFQSSRIAQFQESVIREMTRLAIVHGAVNLAQGFPDFPAPEEVKRAACDAIEADINQYSITWGAKAFRDSIARYYKRFYNLEIDPETELAVCCGATEGMVATMLALLNEGDEVVVFEPFYENYWPDSQLSGCTIRYVPMRPPDWAFDPQELRAAFSSRTRAVILNSPNNPTGRVFSLEELTAIAELCQEFDALAVTDEIYEHITYDGARHMPILALPGMRERSVLVNSLSKTFSVTGWRVGWVVAPPHLTSSIRKVHDFLTVGAAAPLQQAGITALALPDSYYLQLSRTYEKKRDLILDALTPLGFVCSRPQGAYYVMANIEQFGFDNDVEFCRHLVQDIGVAAVPGSSFFSHRSLGAKWVRFCFAKKPETITAAAERLQRLRS
jgi:aspartate/methionine/tyrosine aminotransferase